MYWSGGRSLTLFFFYNILVSYMRYISWDFFVFLICALARGFFFLSRGPAPYGCRTMFVGVFLFNFAFLSSSEIGFLGPFGANFLSH